MVSKTNIKKHITSSTHNTIYERCYSYACQDGYTLSFVNNNKEIKSKIIKNILCEQVKDYLLRNGLEA